MSRVRVAGFGVPLDGFGAGPEQSLNDPLKNVGQSSFSETSHGNLPDDPLSLSMDVGVDSHDFRPWHFDEIQAIIKVKAEAKAKDIDMRQSMVGKDES